MDILEKGDDMNTLKKLPETIKQAQIIYLILVIISILMAMGMKLNGAYMLVMPFISGEMIIVIYLILKEQYSFAIFDMFTTFLYFLVFLIFLL